MIAPAVGTLAAPGQFAADSDRLRYLIKVFAAWSTAAITSGLVIWWTWRSLTGQASARGEKLLGFSLTSCSLLHSRWTCSVKTSLMKLLAWLALPRRRFSEVSLLRGR